MKFKCLSLKFTYTLCVIASLISVYIITENEDIGEAMRPDEYSMGTAYYVVLISVGLMSSAFVVLLFQWPESIQVKLRIWVKAVLITAGIILAGGLLFAIIFGIAMSGGHWAFG